jgi:hypothetical protein
MEKAGSAMRLEQQETRCLYIENVTDLRFLNVKNESVRAPKRAVFCSTSESLKVMDI